MLVVAGNTFAKTAADTLVVTTQPQMHCQNCEKKIKSNIRFVKGTKKIDTSVENQKLLLSTTLRKQNTTTMLRLSRRLGMR